MRLTQRDLQVLIHVARMRYLDRDQVQRIEFGGRATSNVKRRLTVLYHNSLIGRRLLATADAHGSPRSLYYIERAGERALRDAALGVPHPDGKARESQAEPFFMRHLLETNDVWIAALLSARKHGVPLTWHDELELRRALTGVRLGQRANAAFMLAPIPDGYARLQVQGVELSFAIELDRGSTEERRARKKYVGYGRFHAAIADGRRIATPSRRSSLAADDLFAPGMRVLFVASGRDASAELARKDRLLAWCEQEAGGSLFWLTTLSAVRENDLFTAPIWDVAGNTGRRSLIDSAQLAPPPRLVAPAGVT